MVHGRAVRPLAPALDKAAAPADAGRNDSLRAVAMEEHVELDFGPGGLPARFGGPADRITAREPAEAAAALARLDAALAAGNWVAGYASYELGYALEPRLAPLIPGGRRLPLIDFGVFPRGPGPAGEAVAGGSLGPLRPRWNGGDYRAAFERVAEYIRAGDIYQVNLTLPLDGRWRGDPAAIGAALAGRQRVGFGARVALGEPVLLSRSPELFFALDGAGGIEARPMKGTAPRGADPDRDAALATALARDPKNRAENLMIVDLLRNDIGRIAAIGSVAVPALFEVETYATVHQMVSRVVGRLNPGITPRPDLRGALSLRLGHRGAEGAGDGDHPRARALAARGLLRRDRLGGARRARRLQRRDPDADAPPGRRRGAQRRRRDRRQLDRRGGIRGGAVEGPLRDAGRSAAALRRARHGDHPSGSFNSISMPKPRSPT